MYCRNDSEYVDYIINIRKQQAQGFYNEENFEKANESFTDLASICIDKKDSLMYEYKAIECIYRTGNYNNIISQMDDFIRKAMPVNPDIAVQSLIMKGRSHMLLGEQEAAYDTFLSIMVKYPENKYSSEANFLIGYTDMMNGKIKKAEEIFNSIIASFPDTISANKARLCLRRIKRINVNGS